MFIKHSELFLKSVAEQYAQLEYNLTSSKRCLHVQYICCKCRKYYTL